MADALTYQCPNCHGVLEFDSASGMLACAHCDSTFEPQAIEALYARKQAEADAKAADGAAPAPEGSAEAAPGEGAPSEAASPGEAPAGTSTAEPGAQGQPEAADPVQAYLSRANWEKLPEDQVIALDCTSCGAQLMADRTTAATRCPYCGNSTIVGGQLAGALKPDLVIPFKKDRDAAIAAYRAYCSGKKLLPDAFLEEGHIQEITGVYVPFWLYTGNANAALDTSARNVRVWVDTKNTYTATDHFNVHRAGTMAFHQVPVDGSAKMPDAHMDAIEPFDYGELAPFSLGYLPGYLTDRYDQDVHDCEGRMHGRVSTTCGSTLQGTIGSYMEVDPADAAVTMNVERVDYALLPVWMLHTRWRDGDYLFAMNGQTGKVVGDLPIDGGKCAKLFLKWFVPVLLVLLIVLVVLPEVL